MAFWDEHPPSHPSTLCRYIFSFFLKALFEESCGLFLTIFVIYSPFNHEVICIKSWYRWNLNDHVLGTSHLWEHCEPYVCVFMYWFWSGSSERIIWLSRRALLQFSLAAVRVLGFAAHIDSWVSVDVCVMLDPLNTKFFWGGLKMPRCQFLYKDPPQCRTWGFAL